MTRQIKLEPAPIRWMIDDLLTTILDSSADELPALHTKLLGLAISIQSRTDADFAQVAQGNTTNQQILDRIELKLQEHLSQSYTNAIRGHKNEPKPRAKELMDFITDMLKLEVEKEGK